MKSLAGLIICSLMCQNSSAQHVFNPFEKGTKVNVSCKYFDQYSKLDLNNKKLSLNIADSTALPDFLTKPPKGVEYCGCQAFNGTAYFVTQLNPDMIFTYYRNL